MTEQLTLEERIKIASERAVIQFISQPDAWLMPKYEDRVRIPPSFLMECWRLVDTKKVVAQIATLIEAELAQRIVNTIAAEMATDIKQVLSVQERREAIRALARAHMDSIMRLGSTPAEDANG